MKYDPFARRTLSQSDGFTRRLLLVTACLATLLAVWQLLPALVSWFGPQASPPRSVMARGNLAADEIANIELFEKSRDSVVFISTSQLVRDAWTRNVFAIAKGTGSGVVWNDAGYVVTNDHVIEGASEATVKPSDGRAYKAFLVGTSPSHDIAVLKIDAGSKYAAPIPVGTSKDLRVGQKVFAIGNPFGLDWTLPHGIISALDRSLTSEQNGSAIEHLIQIDAAINPGNSGGPLIDSAGRLVGINTAIYSPSGASAGIGFAVPIDTVMRVVPQLIKKGRYVGPSLGIDVDAVANRQLAEVTGIEGVFILRVIPGSAAEQAGLKGVTAGPDGLVPGDVITAVEGKMVDAPEKVLAYLDDYRVGDMVRLTVKSTRSPSSSRDVRVRLQPGW
jgi:S1-C subfamily serine protease